jgi:DNA-directed RNA polymerase specialized sigma54-like protein
MSIDDSLPNDVATLQSMLMAERTALLAAQSEAQYRAVLIEKLKFTSATLARREASWVERREKTIANIKSGIVRLQRGFIKTREG